jgi:hypothetical protein
MLAIPYRLVRNVMIAAGVLYCSLLVEAVAGYPLSSVAMGIFGVLALRRSGWGGVGGRVVAVLAAGVAVTQAWLGIETGLEVLTGDDLRPPGILQRVSVVLVCLMLATLLPGLRQAFLQ